jgi:hypothetical protein
VRTRRSFELVRCYSFQSVPARSNTRSKVRDVIMKVRRRINHKDMVKFLIENCFECYVSFVDSFQADLLMLLQ